jgi:hypothetical protein
MGYYTLQLIEEAVVSEGLAPDSEVDALLADLLAFAEDTTTIVSQPRVFQVHGRI